MLPDGKSRANLKPFRCVHVEQFDSSPALCGSPENSGAGAAKVLVPDLLSRME